MGGFNVFIMRAIIGVVFAVICIRMYYGKADPVYVAGLAVILIGLAYFSEYLRKRRQR